MTNAIVNINYDNPERPTVSGRELHAFLNIETPYAKWFSRMTEYGFAEGEDFVTLVGQKCLTNNPKNPYTERTDHQLTIPMAKELCMIQRNERGKIARKYFLNIEEQWNSPEAVMSRAVLFAQKKNEQLICENRQLIAENRELRPKAEFADAITASPDAIPMAIFAKVLNQNGILVDGKKAGQNNLFAALRNQGFLSDKKGLYWNTPYQHFVSVGYFQVTQRLRPNGTVCYTTRITPKGQKFFIKHFKKIMNGEAV